MKKTLILFIALFLTGCQEGKVDKTKTDWHKDSLSGAVKTIRVESSKLNNDLGNLKEEPRGIATEKKYDMNGLEIEEASYHPNGSLLWKFSYVYANNYKKERLLYAPNGNENEKTIYNYNQNGIMIEEATYRGEESMHSRISYAYDEKDNRTESLLYNRRGAIADKWVYVYNEKGLKNEEARYYADGSLDTKYIYTYDDKGNPKERMKYNSKGELLETERYEYEFDERENWIKRTTLKMIEGAGKNDYEPVEATYRTITYF